MPSTRPGSGNGSGPKGVSCHTLPALRAATASDWPEVHLVRVNPQGSYIDNEQDGWEQTPATTLCR